MRFISPLRYPGGKAKLAPYIASLINAQQIPPRYYAEPFAGGAGAALKLLHEGIIEHVYLNDLNRGIAAFWRAITQTPEEFNHLITTCELNIDAWKHYKNIYDTPQNKDDLTLGFATFYLNRTCRSGILGARPIGGMEQTGKWKIDARFNRDNLSHRIRTIAAMADNITITESEGIDFLTTMEEHGENIFVYADPPYLGQGEGLYLHAFDEPQHKALAKKLANATFYWMLTYDDDPFITEGLYHSARAAIFPIAHTAHHQHVGAESIIYSSSLTIPNLQVTKKQTAQWTPNTTQPEPILS